MTSTRQTLTEICEQHDLPALAAAVVRDTKTLALAAVGVRRKGHPEPVSDGDLWHLGSCSKAMTATMIARLVEAGSLSWTTSLAESFAELQGEIDPAWNAVTLEQLLSHRSGLPEDRQPDAVIFPRLRQLSGPMRRQRLDLVRLVLGQSPLEPPGSRMIYSNAGYAVAAAMAEQASGETWESLMRNQLFQPLGMTSAGFGPPGRAGFPDQPRGHDEGVPLEPGPEADNPPVSGPSNAVHCSLADFSAFAALHLTGARGETSYLGTDSFAALHRPRGPEGYALGWAVGEEEPPLGPTLSHVGSNGLWTAVAWLSPPQNLACLVTSNAGVEQALDACRQALDALLQPHLE